MTDRCPTCGRAHPAPTLPRVRTCWACGRVFTQTLGRRRITCTDPACLTKRRRYRKAGLASLDRMESA